jgi:hypothetical protein
LGRIHIDIMGGGEVFAILNPGKTLPKNGFTPFNYVIIITDDATRFRWEYGLITREHKEIAEKLRQWADHIKAQGFHTPAFYRSDNEFGSGLIKGLLASWGTRFEPSNPDSPWQNEVAERANRIILGRARAMLIGAGMGDEWWYEAIRAAIQLINLSPTNTVLYNDPTPGETTENDDILPLQTRIPQTALYNVMPKIGHFLPFGSIVHVTRHGSNKPENKVAARTTIGRVVGYVGPNNYLIYDPEKDIEFMSGDITPSGFAATAPVPRGVKPMKNMASRAEYLAASDAAREAEWLRRFINDMGLYVDGDRDGVDSIPFYMDSKGARDLIASSTTTRRSKHIDVRYHYVRDIAARKVIEVMPIGTEFMAADGFTKSLAADPFRKFLRQIGVS